MTDAIQTESGGHALDRLLTGSRERKYGRFVFAALGSVPWIGGAIAASAALHSEAEQGAHNGVVARWLQEHDGKIGALGHALEEMADHLDGLQGEMASEVERRLTAESYLALVRQGFRVWDQADTAEKRQFIQRSLENAASTQICSDDIVRMFNNWIDKYDEAHFAVVKVLYHHRGATRAFIWDQIHGQPVREDSAEADLFKLLIFDLNTGRVLRQIRDKNMRGQFLTKKRQGQNSSPGTLESAFENTKPYELTALGSQFVHYVMNEPTQQIEETS